MKSGLHIADDPKKRRYVALLITAAGVAGLVMAVGLTFPEKPITTRPSSSPIVVVRAVPVPQTHPMISVVEPVPDLMVRLVAVSVGTRDSVAYLDIPGVGREAVRVGGGIGDGATVTAIDARSIALRRPDGTQMVLPLVTVPQRTDSTAVEPPAVRGPRPVDDLFSCTGRDC